MNKQSKGFTLIELLIVVAIIAILAAIAIPQYQKYAIRSAVARVVAETGSLKTAWESCVIDNTLTPDTCNFGATGSNLQSAQGANTSKGGAPKTGGAPMATMLSDGSGSLIATFGGNANPFLTSGGYKVVWQRDADGTWTCSTTVPQDYVSPGCSTSPIIGP